MPNQEEVHAVRSRIAANLPEIDEKLRGEYGVHDSYYIFRDLARGKDSLLPDKKEEWLEALRSGDYPQTQDHLHDGEGYCCLGVLCDLHRNGFRWKKQVGGHYLFGDDYHHSTGLVIEPLSRQITKEGRGSEFDAAQDALVTLNDQGFTFEEIADIVELIF